jgi:hypothetical protein
VWFSGIANVGGSSTVTTYIDYTVRTAFQITDHRIELLREQPWVDQVNRRRGDSCLQLIVQVAEMPPELCGDSPTELLRAYLLKILRGW